MANIPPIPTNVLPQTNARLSSSLILRIFTTEGFDTASQLFEAPISPGKVLRNVTKFKRTQDTTVFRRYQLGEFSREPRDVTPLQIKTTLQLERVVLYREDFLESFGLVFSGNLIEQFLPFMIHETQTVPDGIEAKTKIIEYVDCWITTNPMSYTTDGDQLVLQDVMVECGQVRTIPQVDGVTTGILPGIPLSPDTIIALTQGALSPSSISLLQKAVSVPQNLLQGKIVF